MRVVILAGGFGTRLSEETLVKPKPMVEIGGKPMLWHIMKIYSHFGHNEFVICLGYKGYLIKEYFANYFLHMADVTFDMEHNTMDVHNRNAEPWKVTLVDTGDGTMTGGRIKRVAEYVQDDTFMLTYGDGVADVDVDGLITSHQKAGRLATVTAVQPSGRFGALDLDSEGTVSGFQEKPRGDGSWINGGFFVLEPGIMDCIDGDDSVWERGPMEQLARDGQLGSYKHAGYWKPMDTLRDKVELDQKWEAGDAPWKLW